MEVDRFLTILINLNLSVPEANKIIPIDFSVMWAMKSHYYLNLFKLGFRQGQPEMSSYHRSLSRIKLRALGSSYLTSANNLIDKLYDYLTPAVSKVVW